jgi:hypothetical protein
LQIEQPEQVEQDKEEKCTKEFLIALGKRMDEERSFSQELAAERLRIRLRNGPTVPLIANRAQQKFEELRGKQNIVLKARQMGMTTWVAGRFFLRTITHPGTLTVQVAHTQAAVEAIFRMVQRMWENLPDDWRKGPLRRSRANIGQMVFPELDSEFRVWSAADINAGRGLSMQNLHCSEVSRWPGDAAATLAGLRAALAPDGELVLESTPNGASGAFYEEWRAAELTQHFLPWWLEPAYVDKPVASDRVTEIELALMEEHHLRPEQIGYRRKLERKYGKLRSQEFAEDAETCFRATGDCFFEIQAIDHRMLETPEPYEQLRNGALLRWSFPQTGRDYLVAVDTAGGGRSGDFCAVQVIDMGTGIQAMELQQRLRPSELTEVVVALANEYNDAMVVVERNNTGYGVLAHLKDHNLGRRVYSQNGEDGWYTSAESKEKALNRLNVLLSREPNRFMSQRFLGECRTFVNLENNKIGAAGGAHDDLVMAMAIGQAVREEKLRRK